MSESVSSVIYRQREIATKHLTCGGRGMPMQITVGEMLILLDEIKRLDDALDVAAERLMGEDL
jgi:hypothetical protein